jgi:MoaA/NifB/PqqE/SkfB family radical SAM enzyme
VLPLARGKGAFPLAGVQSPHLVDWAITWKCNLSCRHCRGMTEGELSAAEAKRLVAEIAELDPGWVIVEG